MKKLVIAAASLLLAGGLWAACMGPFCWDDTGASVAGLRADGNGLAMPVMSSTTINGIKPVGTGQEILCNTCSNAGSSQFGVCIDTATNAGAWVLLSSTTQKCQ